MNWKNRLTNYNFWISIVSAVLLILQAFEFHFDIMYINEIATAVLGLLVVIGIINDPTKTSVKKENATTKANIENVDSSNKTNTEVKDENVELVEENHDEVIALNDNVSTQDVTDKTMLEEQSFPIDEQNEIDNEPVENDIENFVNAISNANAEEKLQIEEVVKNLLNLLKNNEKISKNAENSENFSNNVKNLIENNELHINKDYVVNEVENFDVTNFEDVTDIKTENNIRSTEESGMEFEQISSFNIVN